MRSDWKRESKAFFLEFQPIFTSEGAIYNGALSHHKQPIAVSTLKDFQRKRGPTPHKYGTGSRSDRVQGPLKSASVAQLNAQPPAVATGLYTRRNSFPRFKTLLIVIVERVGEDPVATAPGSVFVDPRCQTFCLRGLACGIGFQSSANEPVVAI